jgi:hypothetical protein
MNKSHVRKIINLLQSLLFYGSLPFTKNAAPVGAAFSLRADLTEIKEGGVLCLLNGIHEMAEGDERDIRYRYEFVEQDGPAPVTEEATASTLRTRLGFRTGSYNDFQGLMEIDLVGQFGDEDYNDGKNGNAAYPVIADPATEELNQLWLSWAGLPNTTIQAGRQVINLDNQRFSGSVRRGSR